MYAFLIVIHIIACLILVLVILLQAGRGGGLSEAFGIGSTSTIFGTSASKFLQKMTAVSAALFLLTSLSLTVLSSHKSKSIMNAEQLKKVMPDVVKPTLPLSGASGAGTAGEATEELPLEEEATPER